MNLPLSSKQIASISNNNRNENNIIWVLHTLSRVGWGDLVLKPVTDLAYWTAELNAAESIGAEKQK